MKSDHRKLESGAYWVALGILFSRIVGLVRDSVFAHYFGNSNSADAFRAAQKIPNFLQNLFGEGVLSASFIPVYANLLDRDNDQARHVAQVVATLLSLATIICVGLGIFFTPQLIDLIAPGFEGEKQKLTIRLVQIIFLGTGLLVLSAWCLGILNSHRRLFIPYAAPAIWSLTIVLTLIMYGRGTTQEELAIYAAWGLVAGSALQFLIQLPFALKHLGSFRLRFDLAHSAVQTVLKNFVPAVTARGVVQLSAYIDNVIASYLPTGAVATLSYAQTIYLMPVSLFGMAVAAAELPTMSRASGSDEEVATFLRHRLASGLTRIAFYVVPSAGAFVFIGDAIVGAIYQSGSFTAHDTRLVWIVLSGSAIGLLASTFGRLYASAFYALKDTRTPLKYAVIRVITTTLFGFACGLYLPPLLHIDAIYGTVGLTATAGLSGWIEFLSLKSKLDRRIGSTGLPRGTLTKLWLAVGCAALVTFGIRWTLPLDIRPLLRTAALLPAFGLVYLFVTRAFGFAEAEKILKKIHLSF